MCGKSRLASESDSRLVFCAFLSSSSQSIRNWTKVGSESFATISPLNLKLQKSLKLLRSLCKLISEIVSQLTRLSMVSFGGEAI